MRSTLAIPPVANIPAAFPSLLRTSGRKLVDSNNYVMSRLKGFNAQIVPWGQADFDNMAAIGATFCRQVIFWDAFQPTNATSVDATMIADLDTQLARAQAAGMYSFLDIHLNVNRDPSWVTAQADETATFTTYGQFLTQYLASRYGDPTSPQYTKSVIGLGLNEPPVNNTTLNGNGAIPYIEGQYRTVISWFRAYAPNWIGFVGYAYSCASPIFDPSFQNASATNADPQAYDSVGGNVIIDFHDYMVGVTGTPTNGVSANDPTAQVRLSNGMPYPDYQGGPLVEPDSTSNPTYTSNATIISQMSLYIAAYKQFCNNANIPLMTGEWGWVSTATGEVAYVTDKETIWADAGTIIENEWDYDVTPSQDEWAAYPNHAWRSSTAAWMSIGNLLTANQSDIETDATGWFSVSDCTLAQTTAQAFNGTHSLALTCTSSGTMIAATNGGSFSIMAGHSYTLSGVSLAFATPRAVTFGVNWYNTGFTLLSGSTITAVTNSTSAWTMSSGTVTAPTTAASAVVTVQITGPLNSEVHYIDYVRFIPLS